MPDSESDASIAPTMSEPQDGDRNHSHETAKPPYDSNGARVSSRRGMPWPSAEKNLLVELTREPKASSVKYDKIILQAVFGKKSGFDSSILEYASQGCKRLVLVGMCLVDNI